MLEEGKMREIPHLLQLRKKDAGIKYSAGDLSKGEEREQQMEIGC